MVDVDEHELTVQHIDQLPPVAALWDQNLVAGVPGRVKPEQALAPPKLLLEGHTWVAQQIRWKEDQPDRRTIRFACVNQPHQLGHDLVERKLAEAEVVDRGSESDPLRMLGSWDHWFAAEVFDAAEAKIHADIVPVGRDVHNRQQAHRAQLVLGRRW